MEYREAVEAAAIMLVIERAGDDELTALRSIIASSAGKENEETGLRDGGDFHVAPSGLSRNKFFADAMSGALTRLGIPAGSKSARPSLAHTPARNICRSSRPSNREMQIGQRLLFYPTAEEPASGC